MLRQFQRCLGVFIGLWMLPCSIFAAAPVPTMVVFGDSLSDIGNTTHLLKSLRQEEDPAFLVAPFKAFVINKMTTFAEEYYVPQVVLDAGLSVVNEFFDHELSFYLTSLIARVRLVPILPGKPYWHYRFSNGRVWNEYLAQMWSLDQEEETVYVNKAFGGSWAATYNYQLTVWNLIRHPIDSIKNLIIGKLVPPSLGLTVQAYLLEHQQLNKQAAYFIFTGGNDYVNMFIFNDKQDQQATNSYVENVVDSIGAAIKRLVKANAQHVIIMGLPSLGEIPKFVNTVDRELLNQVTTQHNELLAQRVKEWQILYPDTDFLYVPTDQFLQKAIAAPQQFGFTNIQSPCLDVAFSTYNPTQNLLLGENYVLSYVAGVQRQGLAPHASVEVCDTPEQYLFWDELHPSTRAHHYLAYEVCKVMKEHGYEVRCIEPSA